MKQNTFRPRDLLNKEVAGIHGVARLTDKARAAHAGEIGSYKYGADSEQDMAILFFLGISAETFQDAAVRIDHDVKLGAWILDNCERSSEEVSKFNRKMKAWWQNKMQCLVTRFQTAAANWLSNQKTEGLLRFFLRGGSGRNGSGDNLFLC